MNFRTTWKEYSAEVEAENKRQREALVAYLRNEERKVAYKWRAVATAVAIFALSGVFYAIFRGH